jgi:glycosyltransferase involved in cell wall biosynthesis
LKKSPQVLLAHPGIQHAPRLAEALEREGVLYRFWTGWAQAGAAPGRRTAAIPAGKLRTRPWAEVAALILHRTGLHPEKVWHWRNAAFQALVPKSEIRNADVVVGFDTAGWILARRAKRAGKIFVLEQSIAHPAARAEELRKIGCGEEVWPEAFRPRPKMVVEAEREEHKLADRVVAASTFTRQTLVEHGVAEEKIRVLPYGVGQEFLDAGQTRKERAAGRKMRFLFLGHLSARKGLRQLLEAWRGIEGGELVLMGGGDPGPWRQIAGEKVIFSGGGDRSRVLEEMKKADVFVFPSLFEGFGLVLLEAMAAGLPILTTKNTAGPDLIEQGKEGQLVRAGNVKDLTKAMASMIRDPAKTAGMGQQAHVRARQFTWENYAKRYREEILG